MDAIEHSPVAIVQECRAMICEFYMGLARPECIEAGHSIGVDYVRADAYRGAVDVVRNAYERLSHVGVEGPDNSTAAVLARTILSDYLDATRGRSAWGGDLNG